MCAPYSVLRISNQPFAVVGLGVDLITFVAIALTPEPVPRGHARASEMLANYACLNQIAAGNDRPGCYLAQESSLASF